MSTAQTTVQQYEPLRPPSTWTAEERKLIQQLTDRFDDLYSRFNRLRFEDMGTKLQKRLTDTEATLEVQADKIEAKVDESDYQARLTITSEAIDASATRITTVETTLPDLATKTDVTTQVATLQHTADGLSLRIATSEGNLSTLTGDAQALKNFKAIQETIIRLESAGIIVGSSTGNTSVLIANNRVAIRDQHGNEVTRITDNNMDIENASIRSQLTVGLVARVKLGDGSCGDKWIGA